MNLLCANCGDSRFDFIKIFESGDIKPIIIFIDKPKMRCDKIVIIEMFETMRCGQPKNIIDRIGSSFTFCNYETLENGLSVWIVLIFFWLKMWIDCEIWCFFKISVGWICNIIIATIKSWSNKWFSWIIMNHHWSLKILKIWS